MVPELGRWYAVTSGPHKGREGVCDLIESRKDGKLFFRITNPQMIVGRFPADMLRSAPQRPYESQVSPETYQRALDLLMTPRKAAQS